MAEVISTATVISPANTRLISATPLQPAPRWRNASPTADRPSRKTPATTRVALWNAAWRETWMSIFQPRLRAAAMASSGATMAVATARPATSVGETWRNSTASADSAMSNTNSPPSAMVGRFTNHFASSDTLRYRFSSSSRLHTAMPSRAMVPTDSSETAPGAGGSTSTITATTSTATKPITANACVNCPGARTARRNRCRMNTYHATERSRSSAPGMPDSGASGSAARLAAHSMVIPQAPASSQPVWLSRARSRISAVSAA